METSPYRAVVSDWLKRSKEGREQLKDEQEDPPAQRQENIHLASTLVEQETNNI